MPPTHPGGLFTINFGKLHFFFLQLQKFAVPLHCQQKRTAPKRPPVGSSLTILSTVRRCGGVLCLCVGEMPVSEMLFACWSVGSWVARATRKNLTICQYAMMSGGVSGVVVAAKMTRAEAEASDDIYKGANDG